MLFNTQNTAVRDFRCLRFLAVAILFFLFAQTPPLKAQCTPTIPIHQNLIFYHFEDLSDFTSWERLDSLEDQYYALTFDQKHQIILAKRVKDGFVAWPLVNNLGDPATVKLSFRKITGIASRLIEVEWYFRSYGSGGGMTLSGRQLWAPSGSMKYLDVVHTATSQWFGKHGQTPHFKKFTCDYFLSGRGLRVVNRTCGNRYVNDGMIGTTYHAVTKVQPGYYIYRGGEWVRQ